VADRPKTPEWASPRSELSYRVAKRTLDIVGSSVALLLLAAPMALIALAVWVEDRHPPILFRQRRCGMNGTPFALLKFRTMVANADELKEQLRAQSVVPWPDFRLENDPRVSRVGRFLRKTSLDELPQFVNVLIGQMSLIGPRPTSFAASTYEPWQTGRLDFRPGVTGPWQVWGRTTMNFEERCRLEIRFFRRRSILAELYVLLVTARAIARRTGVA
jgi:lipopolysaccharide/colanic/teichoic acid biosynthesis glycosyltransferase